MKTNNLYQGIVPFIFFVLALIILFMLVRPMITILLSSILLAYISFPLHKKIFKKIPSKPLSIILSLLIIVIIILIPFIFLIFGIAQQGFYFYNSLSDNLVKGALFGISCESTSSQVCLILNQAEKFSVEQLSKFGFDKQIQKFLPILEEELTRFIFKIPIMFGGIILTLIISYFILSDWENLLKNTLNFFPMKNKTIKRFTKEFKNITHTVIYAQLVVAIVQGIVAIIGFYIFGVPFPLVLGVLLAFCSLIPLVGTGIIWVPASIFLILSGYFSNDYWVMGKGIGLFFYGVLIISLIDDLLLAKLVRRKAKVSPIITIVGVIGGASLFGIMGIFIGPILLPLILLYFETFKERFD